MCVCRVVQSGPRYDVAYLCLPVESSYAPTLRASTTSMTYCMFAAGTMSRHNSATCCHIMIALTRPMSAEMQGFCVCVEGGSLLVAACWRVLNYGPVGRTATCQRRARMARRDRSWNGVDTRSEGDFEGDAQGLVQALEGPREDPALPVPTRQSTSVPFLLTATAQETQ